MFDIKLGSLIKDEITNVTGMAISKVTFTSGLVKYVLQPPAKEGENTMPDAYELDHHCLTVVNEDKCSLATPCKDTHLVPLGAKVQDIYSGLVGFATAKVEHMNGCTYYVLQPMIKSKSLFDGKPASSSVPQEQLVIVVVEEERIEHPVAPSKSLSPIIPAAVTPSAVRPGGPVVRMKHKRTV